jgi:hypothetical protein
MFYLHFNTSGTGSTTLWSQVLQIMCARSTNVCINLLRLMYNNLLFVEEM